MTKLEKFVNRVVGDLNLEGEAKFWLHAFVREVRERALSIDEQEDGRFVHCVEVAFNEIVREFGLEEK